MYVLRYPSDSTGTKFDNAFGFGTAVANGNSITETSSFSNGSTWFGKPIKVDFKLDGDTYTQTIVDTATKMTLIEAYKKMK